MYQYLKFIKRQWANHSFVKSADIELKKPIVSFTFDDAPASAFENGGNILSNFNFAGTFYVALSFLNSDDMYAAFSAGHLKEAHYNKHELGCHTYNHIQLGKTSIEESISDIERNQKAIERLIPRFQFSNFSYPYGEQTKPIKQYLSGRFRSARGVLHGINTGKADLLNLKAVRLYEKQFSLNAIVKIIEKAVASNAWLIFYTHDVSDNPSSFGCSTKFFEAVVKEVSERALRVMTVNDALDAIELAGRRDFLSSNSFSSFAGQVAQIFTTVGVAESIV